jgi:DNA invertase Pin-like site-specific DNA recombinase
MQFAQAREIDAILVAELSHWGRSTQDLVHTLNDLHSLKVSVLARTDLSFDLSTARGKLMRTIMTGLTEFERDLIRERVNSGLAAARARGVALGRSEGLRKRRPRSSVSCTATAVLSPDRPQPGPLQEHRDGDRSASQILMAASGRLMQVSCSIVNA